MLMERAGLVTRSQLVAGRRYAIVAAFIVAAILTPPDVVSQLMLAIPLIVLYELSLIGIWFTERRRADASGLGAEGSGRQERDLAPRHRSEQRRVGTEWVGTCRSRGC